MSKHADIGREVVDLEIAGLTALRDSLGGAFAEMVATLAAAEGRIIVTGMGKSGHVGRKIAATFSSTGAPAMFVHPAEASHGDLGMITDRDIVLALSKSGETAELENLLHYAARFSIAVAAITAAPASPLAKAADIVLVLPEAREACGETRAPTTSTTMMLAAGDALAVALLRDKGFSANDFKGFHPGGHLGAALRRVTDLMHRERELPLAPQTTTVESAIAAITAGGFGCVGLIDDAGALTGIITDGDLRRLGAKANPGQTAADVMTKDPRTVTPDALAGDVLALMSREKITALFVVENGKPMGIVHVHDCLSFGVL
ncbi:MAG: KpsF/GutQ family sugar-phosphate isomerase [Pseudomonadota bacterium]